VTPLPAALLGGSAPLVGWRLDSARFAGTWDSGEGARLFGGRWSSIGQRAVYAAFDPATAILEVAVHKGFAALEVSPHVLTSFVIHDMRTVHVVRPEDVPDGRWLIPAMPGQGQQTFGDTLLRDHRFVAIPSVVSSRSWNLVFNAAGAAGTYTILKQEEFALDPRLRPVKP
jgi:RES domain-containing protein